MRGLNQIGPRERIDKVLALDPESTSFWAHPPYLIHCSLMATLSKTQGEAPGTHWAILAGII